MSQPEFAVFHQDDNESNEQESERDQQPVVLLIGKFTLRRRQLRS